MAQTNFIKFFNSEGQDYNFIPYITPDEKTRATADLTISGSVSSNGTITVSVKDSVHGMIVIGSYQVELTTDLNVIASNLANNINRYGYNATSNFNTITVYAPESYGSNMVGMDLITTFA